MGRPSCLSKQKESRTIFLVKKEDDFTARGNFVTDRFIGNSPFSEEGGGGKKDRFLEKANLPSLYSEAYEEISYLLEGREGGLLLRRKNRQDYSSARTRKFWEEGGAYIYH